MIQPHVVADPDPMHLAIGPPHQRRWLSAYRQGPDQIQLGEVVGLERLTGSIWRRSKLTGLRHFTLILHSSRFEGAPIIALGIRHPINLRNFRKFYTRHFTRIRPNLFQLLLESS